MIVVNGTHFEQLVERNGKLPSAEEQKKNDKDPEKLLLHETREEQAAASQGPETRLFFGISSRLSTFN
jgi:hypothetical protein